MECLLRFYIVIINHIERLVIIIDHIERLNSRFFTLSSLRRELSPTCTLKWPQCSRVQFMCNTSSAYHMQHDMLRGTKGPLSY